MSVPFVKTIDNSSQLENTLIYVAGYVANSLVPYSTTAVTNINIANALVPYSTTSSVINSLANALVPYSTTALMNTAISNSLVPYSTTSLMNTAISVSLVPYSTTIQMNTAISTALTTIKYPVTSPILVQYVSTALLPYAQTTAVNTAIADALVPYSTTALTNTAISTATTDMDTITLRNTAISTATSDMDTITKRNTALASYASLTGTNFFTGVQTTTQASDLLVPSTFSSTPSFSMTNGMVYNMSSNSTALSSLGFTNIPATPLQTYVFTFIILPSTASSPWYLKPPTNFISITPVGGTINSSVPLYGISNVVLPTTYTYIMEQITIVNTSTTATPNFISFVSISGY